MAVKLRDFGLHVLGHKRKVPRELYTKTISHSAGTSSNVYLLSHNSVNSHLIGHHPSGHYKNQISGWIPHYRKVENFCAAPLSPVRTSYQVSIGKTWKVKNVNE